MMDVGAALEGFKSRLGIGACEIFDGVVKAVDAEHYTADIEIDAELVLPEVRLRSVTDGAKAGFVCLPKVGSTVVFAKIEGQSDYVLLLTSELDKVVVEIEAAKMEVDKDGYSIMKGGVSLKDVFSDLKTLLENFKVNTPAGPSAGVLPDTLAALTSLETKFNNLLK